MSVDVMQGAPPFTRLFSAFAVLWLVGLTLGLFLPAVSCAGPWQQWTSGTSADGNSLPGTESSTVTAAIGATCGGGPAAGSCLDFNYDLPGMSR